MCRADNALATGDCARRAREVTLKKAQEDNMKLKSDTEVGFHHFSILSKFHDRSEDFCSLSIEVSGVMD